MIDRFAESLDPKVKGPKGTPNALFLASITWNGTRELIYRVHDPEIANALLQGILASRDYDRPFDYRMDDDPQWELAEWHLRPFRAQKPPSPDAAP